MIPERATRFAPPLIPLDSVTSAEASTGCHAANKAAYEMCLKDFRWYSYGSGCLDSHKYPLSIATPCLSVHPHPMQRIPTTTLDAGP